MTSPLTTRTTCWASARVGAAIAAMMQAVAMMMRRCPLIPRRFEVKLSLLLCCGDQSHATRCDRGRRLLESRSPDRTQAYLEHVGLARCHIAAVGKVRVVLERHDEAVIDVSKAEAGLRQLAGLDVVADAAIDDPVLV